MRLLDFIRNGVVLSATVSGGARLLLAPYAVIRDGRLIFYDLVSQRARRLKFDAMDWDHDERVWLIQAGDRVACVGAVTLEGTEAQEAWRRYWLDLPPAEQTLIERRFTDAVDQFGE